MPADTFEILEGDEEGLRRFNGWGPVEILRREDGSVEGVELRRCLRVYDENRRFAPVFDDAERKVVGCDTVLPAVGQATSLGFLEDGGQDIEMMRPGWPKVDSQTLETTAAGVFVAGDLAHGTRLLIDAVASGKAAARSIYRHITGRRLVAETVTSHRLLEGYRRERGYESTRRQAVPVRSPVERIGQPELLVEIGYSSDGSSPRQRAEFRRQLPEFASVMGWIGRSASVYRLHVRQRNPQRIEDFCLAGVGNRQPCDAGLLIHSIFQ